VSFGASLGHVILRATSPAALLTKKRKVFTQAGNLLAFAPLISLVLAPAETKRTAEEPFLFVEAAVSPVDFVPEEQSF